MKRNEFIKNSGLMAFSVAAFGRIQWNGTRFEGDSPTTTDILGPFYRPGAPIRQNLVPVGSKGTAMNLSGTVFKKDGVTPLQGALVEVWQCDEHEQYDNTSDEYRFRGALKTDNKGKYRFQTIIPVPYKATDTMWRPAHIHFRVSSADHQDLITQIYFKGDPYLAEDTSAKANQSQGRILEIQKNSKGIQEVKFDIRMQTEYALEATAMNRLTGLYQMDKGMAEFSAEDDLLFLKWNGQLQEALTYRGNNMFEGGLGFIKATFTLLEGRTEVVISFGEYDSGDLTKVTLEKGVRFLKY